MRNLKKALSLVMAAAMMLSLMVVGVGAVSVKDFGDKDKITYTEAVETMVALNVINGKDDGNYDPEGSLTRAEMAKLVTYILNGGKEPVLGTKAIPTYSDIKGNWAEGYIEYCSNLGVIAGVGDGKFDPSGTLTGSQASKMILVAMGYNPEVFGFVGADWEINVGIEANKAKLYEKLGGMNPSTTITRDEAAQLIYNAIQAPLMVRSWTQNQTTGQVTESYNLAVQNGKTTNSLLIDKFNGSISVGYLTGYSYDDAKSTWTYDFSADDKFNGGAITTNNAFASDVSLKSTEDYTDLFGQQVKVIFKTTVNDTVYGVYVNEGSVLADVYTGNLPGTAVDADASSIKLAGETYKLSNRADATKVYNYGSDVATAENLDDLTSAHALAALRLIDNDGDNKADAVILTPMSVAKVGYVGKDSATFTAQSGFTAIGSKDFDDISIYDDVAQDDYVLYIDAAYSRMDKPTVVKAETESGTIEGTKSSNGVDQFLVDGTWMTATAAVVENLQINDEVEYIALGNRLYFAKVTSGATGSNALAMVYKIGDKASTGVSDNSVEAKIILADGTKKTVTVAKVNGVDVDDTTDSATGKDASGVNATITVSNLPGELVNYKVNNDGEYELKTIPAGYRDTAHSDKKLLGYNGSLAAGQTYDYGKNEIGGYEVAKDAVIFVYDNDSNAAKVFSGQELKNSGDDYGTAGVTFTSGMFGKVNGFTYVQAAVLQDTEYPNVITGAHYGYMTSNAYQGQKVDGKDYVYFPYWNGEETVTARAEGTDYEDFKAGTAVTFDVVSEGVIKNVSLANVTTGQVVGWDGNKKISFDDGSNSEINDDTVILYVNSKDKTGVKGGLGMIQQATDVNGDNTKEDNVRYIIGGTSVALLIVDEDNYMRANPASISAPDVNGGSAKPVEAIEKALASDADTVKVTGNPTMEKALTIPAGKTVNFTGNVDLNSKAMKVEGTVTTAQIITTGANVTVENGGKLVVSDGAGLKVNASNGIAVKAGGEVELGGAAYVGGSNALITVVSGEVVRFGADATPTWTVKGEIKINKDMTLTNDTLNLSDASAKLVVADDVTLTLDKVTMTANLNKVISGGTNATITVVNNNATVATGTFYDNNGNGSTQSSALTTLTAGTSFKWGTIYTDASGATASAWVKQA